MKINYNIMKKYIMCMIMIACTLVLSIQVSAETKQQSIVTLSEAQDLIVVFTFEKEIVDIKFVSPSDVTYSETDSKVEKASGELWSSYKITNAEAGTWKAEYDLGSNSYIDYTVVDSSTGIQINTFKEESSQDDSITFAIKASTEEDISRFSYEIYGVDEAGMEADIEIASGSLSMDKDETCTVDLSSLSSGSYTFRLEIWAMDGDMEVFDSATIEGYEYVNSNTPTTIADFRIYLNQSGNEITVEWDDWTHWSYEAYYLTILDQDGTSIFQGELLSSVAEAAATIPDETSELTVYLRYKSEGIWSSNKVKTVTLGETEYLYLDGEDITGNSQTKLVYGTTTQRTLSVEMNETQSSEYFIEGEGYLGLTLEQGENTIYAIFEGEDNIFYCVDQEVYYDAYPPEIMLYEDLDGKTFNDSTIHILGKMSYGSTLTVNGEEIIVDDDGGFDIEYDLSIGENVILITASDVNGNEAAQALTVYRETSILNVSSDGLKAYIPIVVSLVVSIILIILAALFLKKKEKGVKKHTFLKLVFWEIFAVGMTIISALQFIIRYKVINSIAFLAMAETSATSAAQYIQWKNIFAITTIAGVVISLIVLPLIMVLVKKKNKKQ